MNNLYFQNSHVLRIPASPSLRKNHGFSLVELVVIMAIVGILASVALPSFTQAITSMRAKAASSDLYAALIKTRSEAVKRNGNVTLSVVNGNGWKIYPSAAPDSVLESHAISGNVNLTGAGSVEYNSSGRPTATASFTITVSIGSSESAGCVSLSLSGLPNVKSTAC